MLENSDDLPENSFEGLLARLQEGDHRAASLIVDRYRPRLVVLASNQFETWLRDKADPEGVVQSALASFFRRAQEGRLNPAEWEDVAVILMVITLRKCSNKRKELLAEKRSASREVSLSAPTLEYQPTSVESSPEELAVFKDLLEFLLRGFEERERQLVELMLEGYTQEEITTQTGRPLRSVQRVQARFRDRLRRLREQEGM